MTGRLREGRIAIGCDTKREMLKGSIKAYLRGMSVSCDDFGADCYAEIARRVGGAVAEGIYDGGILICRNGIGVSIAANKIPGVYAANCRTADDAADARRVNRANILTMGDLEHERAKAVVGAWLDTEVSEEERYAEGFRIVQEMEDCYAGQPGSV